ncbi:MAG: 4-hydroxy-tetrahydrodipicolinate synthase [Evtepia gabavorous]|uniref:4-hydroxy-tetrahydrodipicolinate synthase n=1 Tax=Evtepia gabavorous TaxID=2211183 RepID=UPI002E79D82D|nr:4-hydroxy-tetrahydrodipicolinate synthase [Evtepia gabavorous]MEE0065589.1 4-hydroxy-tetrahydrodipicolinate synthase [Evtepia gabavorous]
MKQNHPIFRGIATALITPTTPTGIDYDRFGRLIDWQIQQGINALVICGTTGESSTLTDAEHRRAIAFACERVNGRVPVIAGTGSNETDYAVELTKSACAAGADAVLVVTPYYNKTTQRGLVTMYNTIADASTKPVILYNVPSRTGIGIEPATYVKLAEHPNIAAIKEANSDISKIVETFSLVGDRLDIYSGNDDQIVPILSMGGAGCISVLSNVIPAETVAITQRFFAGDVAGAAQLQCRYMPLIRALFCESNPIPVKAAMAALGYCDNYLRLPLVPMEEDHYQEMLRRMRELGLSV